MANAFLIPKNLVFLALGKEALPLLKRGYIPLQQASCSSLIWFHQNTRQVAAAQAVVSEQHYQQHLRQEYQRLPDNLRGLFSQDDFIQQAEAKKAEIITALLQKMAAPSSQHSGRAADWWIQRFYCNPFSVASWSAVGWDKVWLGFDLAHWPQLQAQPVNYQLSLPASFPERLYCEHPDEASKKEWRVVRSQTEIDKWIMLNQQKTGLLKIPIKSLACALLGAAVDARFADQFAHYWQQDLRYRSLPLATMQQSREDFSWQFYTA